MAEKAEIVPVEEQQLPTLATSGLYPTDPTSMVAIATEQARVLADIIDQKDLYKTISGRKHVLVEGWTTLGAMLGVFPVVVWTRESEDFRSRIEDVTWTGQGRNRKKKVEVIAEGQGTIYARVEARALSGALVGAAEAECSYTESKWRTSEAYALRSMAQTRATSKALRLPLGFVMALAGYEATPEEEMSTDHIIEAKKILFRDLLDAKRGDKEAQARAGELWLEAKTNLGLHEMEEDLLSPAQTDEILETIREQLEEEGPDDDSDK